MNLRKKKKIKFNLINLPFKLMDVAWLNLITYFTNVFVLNKIGT